MAVIALPQKDRYQRKSKELKVPDNNYGVAPKSGFLFGI